MFQISRNRVCTTCLSCSFNENDLPFDQLRREIESLFARENLANDFYLRRNMDQCGWIYTSLLFNKPEIAAFTEDLELIATAIQSSSQVELAHDRLRIRPRRNPRKWVTVSAAPCTFSSLNVNVAPFVPRISTKSSATPSQPSSSDHHPVNPGEEEWQEVKRKTNDRSRQNKSSSIYKKEPREVNMKADDKMAACFDGHHKSFPSDPLSDNEVDDSFVNELLIITKTSTSSLCLSGEDKMGDFAIRSKMAAELAQVVDDERLSCPRNQVEEERMVVRQNESILPLDVITPRKINPVLD